MKGGREVERERERAREREEKGERWKDGWRLSSLLLFLCVSFWALPHTGTSGAGEEREGENKPDFYPETGNKRFSESILTQPTQLSLLLSTCVASKRAKH